MHEDSLAYFDMLDFSQVLIAQTDTIIENWVKAVRGDRQIDSANALPYNALRDSMPRVLQAMATVLSQSQDSDILKLVDASLEHGILRAEQGFDPEEIAREYSLLRQETFSTLEADLLDRSPAEVLRAFRLIDAVVDEAIARCFKSYTDSRLRELEQLQSQLSLTNQELTRLVRANQDNLSYLAHELKTPLTSIIGYSDLFLRQQRQNTEVRDTFANLEHIDRVLRSGRQLLRLINDALEISRYEAGQMKLQPAPTNVRDLMNNVMDTLDPLARAKELQMVIDCDRAPAKVETDSLRLQQIVTNIVSNAIRYTEVGSINLVCQVIGDDQWVIAVTDTGIGIAPEDKTHIFDPYFRVGYANHSYSINSTGLGLAIVSRLVKLLQGEIQVVSQVGIGSTFTVILPLAVKLPEATLTALPTQVET